MCAVFLIKVKCWHCRLVALLRQSGFKWLVQWNGGKWKSYGSIACRGNIAGSDCFIESVHQF